MIPALQADSGKSRDGPQYAAPRPDGVSQACRCEPGRSGSAFGIPINKNVDARETPACWAEHGDLFEELSPLRTAHQAAFDPAGPPTGPADWHATLANTRARLHAAVARTGCRAGQHRVPDPPAWARADT